MKTSLLAATACVTLAACAPQNEMRQNFNRPAGYQVDSGHFGAATQNNTGIHSGKIQYASNLADRFAAEVNTTITFPFNSASLDQNAQAVLRQQAAWIKQFPEVRFKVYGHTDLVGSDAYNRRLGLQRAQAVVRYFEGQGISRARLEAVSSYGETRPVVRTQDMERQNRRTVTEVTGFVGSHPMVLNGKYAEVVFREYVQSASQLPVTTESDGE